MIKSILAAGAVAISAIASASAGLLAINTDGDLISIDTTTGAGTVLGNTGISSAMGLDGNGSSLFMFDQVGGALVEIDSATGAVLNQTLVAGVVTGEGSLAINDAGDVFVTRSGGAAGTLYSADLSTNTATNIGSFTPSLDGADFYDGVLYGISQSTRELITLNTVDASVTVIGDTGLDDSTIWGGLAFDDAGLGYTVIAGALYSIDRATAAVALIGNIGQGTINGLAFFDSNVGDPVPLPGALPLMFGGLIGFRMLRNKKRAK